MAERRRFPDYSTLAKRDTPSWNDATRRVVDKRLNDPPPRRFFSAEEWATLEAICGRIIPQMSGDRVPVANFVDAKMAENHGDGFHRAGQPRMQEMWRRGLAATDGEARLRFGAAFVDLPGGRQDDLLHLIQRGEVRAMGWHSVPPQSFFKSRVLHDIVSAYYAHPRGWDEMGFGGPASPRGYVRMGLNRHDPWDPVEHPTTRDHA